MIAGFSIRVVVLLIASIFLSSGIADAFDIYEGPREILSIEDNQIPGEILVKFNKAISDEKAVSILKEKGGVFHMKGRHSGVFRVRVPEGKEKAIISKLRTDPAVLYAEQNRIRYAFFIPNDPYYKYQWHFDDTLQGRNPYGGENGGGINVEPAWDLTRGEGVVVAVIDTGVAYENYRDKLKRYYQAPDLKGTCFVQGYDFINNDSHPNDDNSHGTHVAGTIAQSTNNLLGVAGIAHRACIMPVKVLDKNGKGTDFDVAEGIYYAADHGAHVINLSLGGPGSSTTLEDAVKYAYSKGVTIVAAAGNEGNTYNRPMYPAAYDAYVIAVAATRYDQAVSYYSNWGDYIDISAPGGDLNVDQNRDGYGDGVLQQTFNPITKNTSSFGYYFFQGTSMATPHVSATAALVISRAMALGITLTPDQVRQILQSTAEDEGEPGWDPHYGWGIVDASAAVSAVK